MIKVYLDTNRFPSLKQDGTTMFEYINNELKFTNIQKLFIILHFSKLKKQKIGR